MTIATIDKARAQEFAGRFLGHMNGAAIAQLSSIGHRTGLFDTLATLKPSTSAEIARASGLNERYVREWLNGMVVARIVTFAPRGRRYSLPPEHAASLTRQAGARNIATMSLFFPMLGTVEPEVVRSFKAGGGVPYSAYAGFHALMAERSAQRMDGALLTKVVPASGMLGRLRKGIDVLDVGCGSGHAINLLGQAFPNSRFVGYDFSADAIKAARAESKRLSLTNTEFEVKDTARFSAPGRFDLITAFDAIHDQASPRRVLANISRSLREGGMFLMVEPAGTGSVETDIDDPLAIFKYTVSVMHCMTVSLAFDGEGLGTMWGRRQALALLKEAGFGKVRVKKIEGDVLNSYYFARKKPAGGSTR